MISPLPGRDDDEAGLGDVPAARASSAEVVDDDGQPVDPTAAATSR